MKSGHYTQKVKTKMKIAVYAVIAIVLGVIVMLAPLLVFTVYGYHSAISQMEIEQDSTGGRGYIWNETNALPLGVNDTKLAVSPTIAEAAQLYGMLDIKAEPFPSSLFPAVLLAAISFIVALGVSLFFRNRI